MGQAQNLASIQDIFAELFPETTPANDNVTKTASGVTISGDKCWVLDVTGGRYLVDMGLEDLSEYLEVVEGFAYIKVADANSPDWHLIALNPAHVLSIEPAGVKKVTN